MYEVKNLHTQKIPGSYGFTGEFYQSFKNKIILVPHKVLQKFEKEGILSKSFYEASVIQNPNQILQYNEQQINIHYKHKCKNIKQNFCKSNSRIYQLEK